jgi:hypothetical protein
MLWNAMQSSVPERVMQTLLFDLAVAEIQAF